MTDDELSRAVAERRGWVCVADCGVANYQHLHRGNECVDNFAFATSMDACLAPGGLLDWMRRQDRWVSLTARPRDFHVSFRRVIGRDESGPYFKWFIGEANTLPRALCLAFLAATEGDHD